MTDRHSFLTGQIVKDLGLVRLHITSVYQRSDFLYKKQNGFLSQVQEVSTFGRTCLRRYYVTY